MKLEKFVNQEIQLLTEFGKWCIKQGCEDRSLVDWAEDYETWRWEHQDRAVTTTGGRG